MTRRRRRLLIGLAVLALVGVLALPGVQWRLIGWAKGEPFYRGRPASYFARDIRFWFPNGSQLTGSSVGNAPVVFCDALTVYEML